MVTVGGNHVLIVPSKAVEDIRKIYNLDTPERLDEAVNILRTWLLKQDHIIKKDFSKVYLEKTIVSCKGSMEKAKKQIDRLCTMKTLLPKFFEKTNIRDIAGILDLAWLVPLPQLTEDHCRVVLVRTFDTKITSEHFMQYFQYDLMLVEYIKAYDYANGFIVILDYNALNLFDVVSKMNTVELQQLFTILVKGYGARLKSINIMTNSKALDIFVKTIKQFTSEKIGSRINAMHNLEDLHKIVDRKILPIEYGGDEKSIDIVQAEFIKELGSEKFQDYLKMVHKALTDESKRRAENFNVEYMGMPGSFRNLIVD